MTREDLFRKNHALGVEFDLHLLENPDVLEGIPEGAEIVFLRDRETSNGRGAQRVFDLVKTALSPASGTGECTVMLAMV